MGLTAGRLAEAYTCTGACATKITDLGFVYSARGEIKEVWQSSPNSGGYYQVTSDYWANGALKSLWKSGLPTISYAVDGEGRHSGVSASGGQAPVTQVLYNNSGTAEPIGALTRVTFGSGDYDTFSYDPNTGRMDQYQFTVGAQTENANLTWSANGTVRTLQVTNPFNAAENQTCTYTYDDLARLTKVDCGSGKWGQSFDYDPFGNIKKSVLPGATGIAWQPTYNLQNRYQTLPGATPTYDATGNLTYDSFHSYTWDGESRVISIDTTTLTYDALGRDVEQNRGGVYYQMVYAPSGQKLAIMQGQALQQAFVPLPGGGTAEYLSWGLSHYRHPDWLGSNRLGVGTGQNIVHSTGYAPFGEPDGQTGNGELSFTGQNKDTVWLQYDFLFRQYDPKQGRWISPDPAGLGAVNMSNPQTWNRYAYTGNAPLNTVDPMGLLRSDCIGCNLSVAGQTSFGTTYYVNGMRVSARVAQGLLSMGAAAQCPGNCTISQNGRIYQYFATANDAGYVPAGGPNAFIKPINVLVAISDQTRKGTPAVRDITYAAYKLDGSHLTRLTGSNEIELIENLLSGSAQICRPCSNWDVPDDYNIGVFNDEHHVAPFSPNPYSVEQHFLMNDKDAAVFFPASNGQYYGWYSQRVDVAATGITIRPNSAFIFTATQ